MLSGHSSQETNATSSSTVWSEMSEDTREAKIAYAWFNSRAMKTAYTDAGIYRSFKIDGNYDQGPVDVACVLTPHPMSEDSFKLFFVSNGKVVRNMSLESDNPNNVTKKDYGEDVAECKDFMMNGVMLSPSHLKFVEHVESVSGAHFIFNRHECWLPAELGGIKFSYRITVFNNYCDLFYVTHFVLPGHPDVIEQVMKDMGEDIDYYMKRFNKNRWLKWVWPAIDPVGFIKGYTEFTPKFHNLKLDKFNSCLYEREWYEQNRVLNNPSL